MQGFFDWCKAFLDAYGLRILTAIVVLGAGLWLSSLLAKLVKRALAHSRIDVTLHSFLCSAISVSLKIIVVVTVLAMLGVNITTIVTALGAAGVAIALALKDSLSNIASGILILFSHPFSVGDFVEVGGKIGTVRSIELFQTTITTLDNNRVIIPNSKMMTADITNYTAEKTRRVDLILSIDYGSDIELAKRIALETASAHPMALTDPAPAVVVFAHSASSIDLQLRCWVETPNFWTVKFDLLEGIKYAFDANGVKIPFNQLDVHMSEK